VGERVRSGGIFDIILTCMAGEYLSSHGASHYIIFKLYDNRHSDEDIKTFSAHS
jgi:hypothetical protein